MAINAIEDTIASKGLVTSMHTTLESDEALDCTIEIEYYENIPVATTDDIEQLTKIRDKIKCGDYIVYSFGESRMRDGHTQIEIDYYGI